MSERLIDRLEIARRQQFVGRQNERELFQSALTAVEMPFFVLYLFGPGGVGKSSLLREFAHTAVQHKAAVVQLDGRAIDANPDNFLAALQTALAASDTAGIFSTLEQRDGRTVILIDTAELLFPLDGWLQDSFLPRLPHTVFVVLAGRNPPALRWRTDPGWQQLMRVLPIKNLSHEESRAFLMRRQIQARQHETILNFTHGHPLALSLVADLFAQQPGIEFRPEEAPDIIRTLMDQFMQDAPSARHRAALEACSQVRLMTEPLLATMVELDDPHPLFEWLRGLSFIDSDRRGLYPHDLAREALAADLRWRNPTRQAELHTLARTYYMAGFHERDARSQRHILSDYIFLHRDNSIIRAFFDWQSSGTVFTDSYREGEGDRAELLAMIGRHEGETAVQLAAHWLDKQPQGMSVMRQAGGPIQGLLLQLSLEKCSASDKELDPAVAAAWHYLVQHAPLRSGETATLFRFWMAADSYQAVSPVQSRIFLNMVQHYLTTPGLAFTMIPCAEPDFWTAVFGFADLHRLPEADFSVEGRTYGVYGHDWRAVPPLTWLANMAEQELGMKVETAVPANLPAQLPIMDETTFADAVHDALRDFTNEVALQNNPLLDCRCLTNAAGATSSKTTRVAKLQALLTEAAESMQTHPKQIRWYRALHHTYFQPAATQEQAAELLDLPFSTYRRYLRTAIQYVTDWLWAQEIGQ